MRGLLNEQTEVVHRLEDDPAKLTDCGALDYTVDPVTTVVDVGDATENGSAEKCGRCFEDGPRGY
ncbi:hypothetical protein ACFQE1_14970 [Halobium palmae]|uniref:Uncharacterized protein n=1 Tax=Halobium palmae TaxID=1776492 RepID=A0ABD5S267_9EURY